MGRHRPAQATVGGELSMAEAEDIEEIEQAAELVERVAAIDIAKASGMVCVRLPNEDKPGFRTQP
ncbi:hypothetical protein GCM10027162_36170 [Streptomyces incanus]